MGYLSKSDFEQAKPQIKEVKLSLGITCIREMSGPERDNFETNYVGKDTNDMANNRAFRNHLLSYVCDEKGELMFAEGEIGKHLGAGDLQTLFNASLRINGLMAEDVEVEKKESAKAVGSGSRIDSPEPIKFLDGSCSDNLLLAS